MDNIVENIQEWMNKLDIRWISNNKAKVPDVKEIKKVVQYLCDVSDRQQKAEFGCLCVENHNGKYILSFTPIKTIIQK